MKILITGGAGFIGSHITDRMLSDGHEVMVIDNLSTGKYKNIHKKASFWLMDICSPEVEALFAKERPDIVLHHAAQANVHVSQHNPILDAQINIKGSINIFQNCIRFQVKKIIYASSAAVYGSPSYLGIDELHAAAPQSFYGLSKYTAEQYLIQFCSSNYTRTRYSILRYANVYGPRQRTDGDGGMISIFIKNLMDRQSPCIYGDGEQTRDFIYVQDVAEANVKALGLADGEILNIGTGQPASVNHLFRLIKKMCRYDLPAVFKNERAGDIRHSYFNHHKAENTLNWQPHFSLPEGLQRTLEYYQTGSTD